MSNTIKIKAGVFVVVALFLATTVTVNAAEVHEYIIDHGDRGVICTVYLEEEHLLGGAVEIMPPQEPEGGDIPACGGGKSSILTIGAIRYLDDLRLRLRGVYALQFIRFNGQYHESNISGYIEAWLEDGRYGRGNFTIITKWWGGPQFGQLNIDFNGLVLTWKKENMDIYPLERIHVYFERVVDGFEPEIHDRTFEKYLFNGVGQSSESLAIGGEMLL